MIARKWIPWSVLAAGLICLSLVGLPLGGPEPMGNFSGKAVFSTAEGILQVSGFFTLYGRRSGDGEAVLELRSGDRRFPMHMDPVLGHFTGTVDLGPSVPAALEAVLLVGGRPVARGLLSLARDPSPSIRIIRFASTGG